MLHDPSRGAVEPLAGHPRFTKVLNYSKKYAVLMSPDFYPVASLSGS